MGDSLFPRPHSLSRVTRHWEDYLSMRTPWENRAGIWFKREDQFAPLGYGGPNGSKLRQLIWYFNSFRGNKTRVVTGASVQSPQLSMTAVVAAHYGLPCTIVVYSRPHTVASHPNPRVALGLGATVAYAAGPYNPIIQRRVEELTTEDALVVFYGISMPIEAWSPEQVHAFHAVGARQVGNMPKEVRRLIVPAGSCNTLASVLLGLQKDPGNLEELYTIGIGPTKTDWLTRRMRYMGAPLEKMAFRWRHFSLHESGYAAYSDKFKGESWEGIELHPTYEAKIWRWLRTHNPITPDGTTALWIVGSEARPEVVEPFYVHSLEKV